MIIVSFILIVLILTMAGWLISMITSLAASSSIKKLGVNSGNIFTQYNFAAVDPKMSSSQEVQETIIKCVDTALELLPILPSIQCDFEFYGISGFYGRNGDVHSMEPKCFEHDYSVRFCLGDSLAGMNIFEKDITITRDIDGQAIQQAIDLWIANGNAFNETSVVESNEYILNFKEDTLTLPDGIKIHTNEILSLDMGDEVKNRYLNEFSNRTTFKENFSSKSPSNSVTLSKLRIFAGFKIEKSTNGFEVHIICYRFPLGEDKPIIGNSTHPISKLNGYVIDHISFDEVRNSKNKKMNIAA